MHAENAVGFEVAKCCPDSTFVEDTTSQVSFQSSDMLIYPNPSTGQVAIQVEGGFQPVLTIYDLEGREVYFRRLDRGGRIQISDFDAPPGIYTIQWFDTDIIRRVGRLVITE